MSSEGEPPSIRIEYTPEFKRNLRQLAKKYRQIKADLQPLLEVLGQGQTPGDQISGVAYEVYKVRARNSDSGKGKSGGYRIIYQITEGHLIVLVTIYSKAEQEDIGSREIRQIISDYDNQRQEEDDPRDEEEPNIP